MQDGTAHEVTAQDEENPDRDFTLRAEKKQGGLPPRVATRTERGQQEGPDVAETNGERGEATKQLEAGSMPIA